MARARKVAPSGLVRSDVRAGIRAGLSRSEIANRVNDTHATLNQNALNKMITEEDQRQRRVDSIMNRNKSRNVDLKRLVNCRGPNAGVRASIVLNFTDQNTGQEVRFNGVVDLATSGRLANILNTAIQTVIDAAIANKYTPPAITSANRTAGGSYRIDYVECT